MARHVEGQVMTVNLFVLSIPKKILYEAIDVT